MTDHILVAEPYHGDILGEQDAKNILQALARSIHGELMIDDLKLYPGDYNRAEAGSVDRRVWSETGCTCVLITSYDDVIL